MTLTLMPRPMTVVIAARPSRVAGRVGQSQVHAAEASGVISFLGQGRCRLWEGPAGVSAGRPC
ncbi:hypothetical protein, partial [Streptomyces mirabilis]|uniref:hypothetical protein n=1 Tax=Streptomyces mirabilis TaxID=68239 RepID=UPI0034019E65